jgi:rhomboid protease GluP
MFEKFSAHFYSTAASGDYRLAHINVEDILTSSHWVIQKIEMATLVTINVIDATKINPQLLLDFDKQAREASESLTNQFGQIANVYILAGGEAPTFINDAQSAEPPLIIEEYFGQQIYSIFWHVDISSGKIFVPKGQPKKLFNIREMIQSACKDAEQSEFENIEIANRAALNRTPKHRHAIFSYAIIFINAVILLLMYLDGYNAENLAVPIRFGAIRADLIVYNNEWHRLFTAMFLHFGVTHLFANTFGILVFGLRLERWLGRRIFFIIYIFSGLLGSLFSLANLYFFHPYVISAGASGAVYGLIGAIFAYTRITKRSIEGINWYIMLIYIGIGMTMGFATPNIDNFAHLGGLLGGIIIGSIVALRKNKV